MLCFILLLIRIIYPYFIQPDNILIENILPNDTLGVITSESESITSSERKDKKKLKKFDPNEVSYDELIYLGFSERTAKTLIKFRSKGFVFRKKEDLQKVYGISERFYNQIQNYILIKPAKGSKKEGGSTSSFVTEAQKVELNTTDSLALTELKGVGPVFAKRILKYRELLGGYVNISQLKEVYGMNDELFEKLKPIVTVNEFLIKKININTAEFKAINRHPYISYELTKSILNRSRKESLTPEIMKELVTDPELLEKINDYIVY